MNFLSNQEPRVPTKLNKIVDQLVAKMELHAARAADGQIDGEAEEMFAELGKIVSAKNPIKGKALMKRLKIPLSTFKTEKRFQAFKNLNLRNASALNKFELGKSDSRLLKSLAKRWVIIPPEVPGAGIPFERNFTPQAANKRLKFYLRSVKCIDETHSGWGEWGSDEIVLGGSAIDETGDVSRISHFKAGDFDDGDIRRYSGKGKLLQGFNLREGGATYPKVYTLALAMIEDDLGGSLTKWFNRFLDYVDKHVGSAIGNALKTVGIPTVIADLVGAIASKAVKAVLNWIKGALGDDNLGVRTLRATINGSSGNWVSTGSKVSQYINTSFRGSDYHYKVKWYCELS